jgi:LuxR family quorum sensing-dependent transcriptional regulator
MDAMSTVMVDFGFKYFCFNFLPNPTQTFEDVLLANRLPAGWLEIYIEKEFVRADPSIRHCKKIVRPYRWFKESPYDPEREPRAVEVVHRAMDFGLTDGFVIPIASPAGKTGHVWMGGRTLNLSERDLPALHLMALYAFDRVLQLHCPRPKQEPNLTPREREVLTWVALGKPAWEIGEILKISSRTVDEHITHARRKLGAVNRAQAVMIALRDQIIQP